jgi:hypothetical protein
MNQKKAKRFRRIAEASTQGIPYTSYEVGQNPKFMARRVMKLGTDGLLVPTDDFVVPYIFDKVEKGVPKKLGYCTRSVYQRMKKLNG